MLNNKNEIIINPDPKLEGINHKFIQLKYKGMSNEILDQIVELLSDDFDSEIPREKHLALKKEG